MYVDRLANQKGSGLGMVLVSPKKVTIKKSLRLGFSATKNEAEYEALLVGMTIVQKMGGKIVEIFLDSSLVVGQEKGKLEIRDVRMQEYLNQVSTCNQGLSFSACFISLGVEIHMLILWPLLQPPWHLAYLGSFLLITCASLLR